MCRRRSSLTSCWRRGSSRRRGSLRLLRMANHRILVLVEVEVAISVRDGRRERRRRRRRRGCLSATCRLRRARRM